MTAEPSFAGDRSSDPEAALWRAFKVQKSEDARQQLFTTYYPFARRLAARQFRDHSRGEIELAELCQSASAGLLESLDQFDPALGVPFRGYAAKRIRGSILDGLSKASEYRHQISHRNRIRTERVKSLGLQNPDMLSAAEGLEALANLVVDLGIGFMLEDSLMVHGDDEPDRHPTAYEGLAWKQTIAQLAEEFSRLPDREQLILRLHYLDEIGFVQISEILKLSKGRVSQLHRSALELLRRRLGSKTSFRLER